MPVASIQILPKWVADGADILIDLKVGAAADRQRLRQVGGHRDAQHRNFARQTD